MDLELETLVRKRFYVGSIKVTEENMNKVAKWCGGRVNITKGIEPDRVQRRYIRMPIPWNHKVRGRAFAGDYVLQLGDSFRAYTESSVWEFFERPMPASKDQSELLPIPSQADNKIPLRLFGNAEYDPKTNSLVYPGTSISIPAKDAAAKIRELFKQEENRLVFIEKAKYFLDHGPGVFEDYTMDYYLDGRLIGSVLPPNHDCLEKGCVLQYQNDPLGQNTITYKFFHKHLTEVAEISGSMVEDVTAIHLVSGYEAHPIDQCSVIGCGGL